MHAQNSVITWACVCVLVSRPAYLSRQLRVPGHRGGVILQRSTLLRHWNDIMPQHGL